MVDEPTLTGDGATPTNNNKNDDGDNEQQQQQTIENEDDTNDGNNDSCLTTSCYYIPPLPLPFIEITPCSSSSTAPSSTSLSPFTVKTHLRRLCLSNKSFDVTWDGDDVNNLSSTKTTSQNSTSSITIRKGTIRPPPHIQQQSPSTTTRQNTPYFHIPSDDPTEMNDVPCLIRGYYPITTHIQKQSPPKKNNNITDPYPPPPPPPPPLSTRVLVTNNTLVRILSPPSWSSPLVTTTSSPSTTTTDDDDDEDTLVRFDHNIVATLAIRMAQRLDDVRFIGTTPDAFDVERRRRRRTRGIRRAARRYHHHLGRRRRSSPSSSSSPPSRRRHHPSTTTTPSSSSDPCLILHSPPTTSLVGQTRLVRSIARRLFHMSSIDIVRPGMLLGRYGVDHADVALESLCHGVVVGRAMRGERCCLVLEGLDGFLPGGGGGGREEEGGEGEGAVLRAMGIYLSTLRTSLLHQNQFPYPSHNPFYNLAATNGTIVPVRICIIGTLTSSHKNKTSLPPSVVHARDAWSSGGGTASFIHCHTLHPPSLPTRIELFERAFERETLVLDDEAKGELPSLVAERSDLSSDPMNVVHFDVARRCRRRRIANGDDDDDDDDDDNVVTASLLRRAFHLTPPPSSPSLAARGHDLTVSLPSSSHHPSSSLSTTVGGQSHAKRALLESLHPPPPGGSRSPSLSRLLTPPTGTLLYGPPGTGKTLLARSVASSTKRSSFFGVSVADVIRSTIGTSESILRTVFDGAREASPSVVFFDEFQALFLERGRGDSSGRLTSTLLQCMDDVCRWSRADDVVAVEGGGGRRERVAIVAATNAPWMIDKAFLRTGRFDRVIHVGLPDEEERVEILRLTVGGMATVETRRNGGGGGRGGKEEEDDDDDGWREVFYRKMAQSCMGFSGADIVALCRAAAVRCLMEGGAFVEERHFWEARMHDVEGSSSNELVERLKRWKP